VSDPTTPEGRAKLRKLIAALGGGYDGPWKAVYDEGAEHGSIRLDEYEPVFPGAYVEVASTDQLGDIDNEEPDMVVPEYLAAVSPDVMTALLDALDKAETELRHTRNNLGQARYGRKQGDIAITRVRALADDMETWCSPHGISVEYAKRIREALDGDS